MTNKTITKILEDIKQERDHCQYLLDTKYKSDPITGNKIEYEFDKEIRIKIFGIIQALNKVEYIIKSNLENGDGK